METLIEALGLDIKILIAQIINFALLLAILWKIAYKPILKFIHERTAKIEQGLKDAEEAKRAREDAKEAKEQLLSTARAEAHEIIAKAKQQAEAHAARIIEKNKADLQKLAEKTKQEFAAERNQWMNETRQSAAQLVLAATAKLLSKKMDAKENQAYLEKVLSDWK